MYGIWSALVRLEEPLEPARVVASAWGLRRRRHELADRTVQGGANRARLFLITWVPDAAIPCLLRNQIQSDRLAA